MAGTPTAAGLGVAFVGVRRPFPPLHDVFVSTTSNAEAAMTPMLAPFFQADPGVQAAPVVAYTTAAGELDAHFFPVGDGIVQHFRCTGGGTNACNGPHPPSLGRLRPTHLSAFVVDAVTSPP